MGELAGPEADLAMAVLLMGAMVAMFWFATRSKE